MTHQYICFIPTAGLSLGTVGTRPRLTIKRIQDTVADFYDLPQAVMTSPQRMRSVARPRQMAMYLARTMLTTKVDGVRRPVKSLPDIGQRFGGRDHTTVIHAIKTVESLALRDADFADDLNAIRVKLAL